MATKKNYVDQGFVLLHNLVLDLIVDKRLTTLHRYIWYLHYMMGGYRKLVQSTVPITQDDLIVMPKNKMISFPKDMVGLMKLGWQLGDRIVPLHRDSTINRIDSDDKKYVPMEIWDRSYDFNYFYRDTNDAGLFKGAGHNKVGYYDVNLQKRRFEFSVDTIIKEGDKIYIEYIGDGCGDMDTETKIYFPIADTLKAWADYRWDYHLHGPKDTRTEAKRIEYLREKAEYDSNTSDLNADSILAALGRTQTTGPRW